MSIHRKIYSPKNLETLNHNHKITRRLFSTPTPIIGTNKSYRA